MLPWQLLRCEKSSFIVALRQKLTSAAALVEFSSIQVRFLYRHFKWANFPPRLLKRILTRLFAFFKWIFHDCFVFFPVARDFHLNLSRILKFRFALTFLVIVVAWDNQAIQLHNRFPGASPSRHKIKFDHGLRAGIWAWIARRLPSRASEHYFQISLRIWSQISHRAELFDFLPAFIVQLESHAMYFDQEANMFLWIRTILCTEYEIKQFFFLFFLEMRKNEIISHPSFGNIRFSFFLRASNMFPVYTKSIAIYPKSVVKRLCLHRRSLVERHFLAGALCVEERQKFRWNRCEKGQNRKSFFFISKW